MGFLGAQVITRRTWAAPSGWAGGSFVKDSSADSSIVGTFRPASAIQIQLLSDGDRQRDPRVLYTDTVLLTTDQHVGGAPDKVSPDGGTIWYEVTDIGVNDNSLPGSPISHRKYICLRVQEPDA